MAPPAEFDRFVTVVAPGKINLILRVGPKEDDGFHNLLTCFHAVDLWETVTVSLASEYRVTVSGDVNTGEIPLDEDNLVVKAAKAVTGALGVTDRFALHIDKKVPVGGGMGGGSADAAATLIAVNELLGGTVSQLELLDLATGLGADVPFLLEGRSALGRGHGGELEALPSLDFWWVIVPSTEHLSTPLVYAKLDELRKGQQLVLPADVPAGFREALFDGDPEALAGFLHNDMEPAALALNPKLATTLRIGQELGALASMVSGSGPTCVLLARDQSHASTLVEALAERGYHSLVANSPARGAHLLPAR